MAAYVVGYQKGIILHSGQLLLLLVHNFKAITGTVLNQVRGPSIMMLYSQDLRHANFWYGHGDGKHCIQLKIGCFMSHFGAHHFR